MKYFVTFLMVAMLTAFTLGCSTEKKKTEKKDEKPPAEKKTE